MSAANDNAQMAVAPEGTNPIKPIDIGFRWIDDITIELKSGRPNTEMRLKVSADDNPEPENQTYKIKKDKETTIRRISNAKISCDKTREVGIELFEYTSRRRHVASKKEAQILSMKILLADDELYTENQFHSDDDEAVVTITFAYTPRGPGAELRNQVENARKITDEQKVVLDGIRHVHRFFEQLDVLCNAVKEIHPFIEAGCNALLLLYKLCEKHRECRTAARTLVDEMNDLLSYGIEVETLGGMLKVNLYTKAAFESVVRVIEDISQVIKKESKGMVPSVFRDAFSTSYESKLRELKEKFKKAKEGLRNSINIGTWERVMDADLRTRLESTSRAHYSSGEGCLENTRKSLLSLVNNWVHESGGAKTVWVHGRAGSGKSALLNSIAESLESAGIPFTCFPCKRDDLELSNVHKILTNIAYIFAEYYGDYHGFLSNLLRQHKGRSIATGDIKKQSELLIGKAYELISPEGVNRPSVHVILIDALDECRNHRDGDKTTDERSALLKILLDFANTIPWIKILITSRPEPDIVGIFTKTASAIQRIDINDDKWGTSADIRLFVETRSEELELGLSPEQIERFQAKAFGIFIWCTTVFRYIQESKKRRDTVNDILTDQVPNPSDDPHAPLYSLYQRVLDSSVSRADDKNLMESILSVVFVASSHRPLSANAIANILYPNEQGEGKREWVQSIIESLSAIVYVEKDTGAVRTCHPSVLDFIGGMLTVGFPTLSPVVAPFSIGLARAHALVFEGCFSLMNRDLQFNMCQLEDSFRLNKDVPDLRARIEKYIAEALQYASLFWISHLEQSCSNGSDAQVLAFLNSLKTLFWVEALSLMDVVDRGVVILQDCARFFTDQPGVAEIAGEWERFLLAYGDTSKSTPHLYLSALSWLPDSSRLWDIVRGSFSSELPVIANVPAAWNSERWSVNVGDRVMDVAYSADGRLFAAGCEDRRVRFWEARSGKVARELFVSESAVRSIAFSADGRWLASGHEDYNVRLWDLRVDSVEPRVLEGHVDEDSSVCFSSDSKRVVSGSSRTIRVWDVDSGTAIGVPFTGHDYQVNSVTFSADDTRIISGSNDKTVRTWNSETGEQIGKPLKGHSDSVYSVACSLDGRFIASGSADETIILWDAQTCEKFGDPLTGHTDDVNSVCFSADSKLLASGSGDHSVRIWNVEIRSLVCELRGHTDRVFSAAFSPDGHDVLSGSSDGTVRVWNAKGIMSIDQPPAGNSPSVICVSYIPNSNLIASASDDESIHFFDANTGAIVGQPMQGHSLAVSNTGQWLVSGSSDHTLRIWDIPSRKPLGEPMIGYNPYMYITSVAISPDNRLIASSSSDNTVRLWDAATHQLVMTLKGHTNDVNCVIFSVDGNRVVSGSWDCTIRIWDNQTGEGVGHPLKGHSIWVKAVAVSPDGQWIASASWDWTVRIWSMSTLLVVHVLEHCNFVQSVAFSGDSQFLFSGSSGNEIRVWNVRTGQAVGVPLTGHTNSVTSISFTPDGHEFASGSDDGTARVWDTRARTDLALHMESGDDNAELNEEAFRILWNASRASASEDDGWIRDGEKLLLWVPWQHRQNIKNGLKLVIEVRGEASAKPVPDHRKLFRFSGSRWKDIYTGGRSNERAMVVAQ